MTLDAYTQRLGRLYAEAENARAKDIHATRELLLTWVQAQHASLPQDLPSLPPPPCAPLATDASIAALQLGLLCEGILYAIEGGQTPLATALPTLCLAAEILTRLDDLSRGPGAPRQRVKASREPEAAGHAAPPLDARNTVPTSLGLQGLTYELTTLLPVPGRHPKPPPDLVPLRTPMRREPAPAAIVVAPAVTALLLR